VDKVKRIRILTGIGATIALGALAYRIGLWNIAAQLRNLRIALPAVVLTGLIKLFLQTRAWSVALRAEGIEVPQTRLIGIRLASQAAGYLTVMGPAVSEATKLVLLRNPTGMAAATPATLVESGAFWFTTGLLGLAGTCAGFFLIANSPVLLVAAVIFGVALALLGTRRSFLPLLGAAAGRHAPNWLKRAEGVELGIRSFRDRHPKAFSTVLGLDSLAQIVTLFEVSAVLWAVGLRSSVLQVLVIEAAGRVVKILGAWIPGRIGADESGAAASFALLGLAPAAGLVLAAARRVRDLLLCGAGVVWAAHSSREERPATQAPPAVSLCMGD
jgi:hypothetical protein